MHYYATINNIDVMHGDIVDGLSVTVRFERPHGLYTYARAVGTIPGFTFHESIGFMEHELDNLREFMLENSHRIWEYAGKGDKETLYQHFCRISATDLSEMTMLSACPTEEKFYKEILDLKLRFPFEEEEDSDCPT